MLACDWTVSAKVNSPKGLMLEELKKIHNMMFVGNKIEIEWLDIGVLLYCVK
jgi:hypothetical protein